MRAGGVIELTPGGRRLASAASEHPRPRRGGAARRPRGRRRRRRRCASRRRRRSPSSRPGRCSTPSARRHPDIEVELQVARARASSRALLANRSADVTLGPPVADREDVPGDRVRAVPALRRSIVVAAPGHTLAASHGLAPAALVSTPWLLGPCERRARRPTRARSSRASRSRRGARAPIRTSPRRSRRSPPGRGVTLAIAHTVRDELERGALVELDVRGTPISGPVVRQHRCARSCARRRPTRCGASSRCPRRRGRCSPAAAACRRSASSTWARGGASRRHVHAASTASARRAFLLEALELLVRRGSRCAPRCRSSAGADPPRRALSVFGGGRPRCRIPGTGR